MAGPYLGDFASGSRIMLSLLTTDTTGAPTAVSSGSACVRKLNGDTTLAFSGVGAITTSGGLSTLSVFTASAAAFFVTGMEYECFLGAGTVGGTSAIGYPYGTFSIQNRTVDVARWLSSTPNSLISGRVDANAAAVTVSSNLLQISGSNVNTSSAQLGVNVVNIAGTAAAAFTMSANIVQVAAQTASAAAGVTFPATLASTTNITAATGIDVTKVQGAAINPLISGRIDANAAAVTVSSRVLSMDAATIASATFAANAIDSAALATSAVNEIADGALARSLAAESYAAVGAVPTLSQSLFMLLSMFGQFSIATTTITMLKLDGSTTAMTAGMDAGASTATQRIRIT